MAELMDYITGTAGAFNLGFDVGQALGEEIMEYYENYEPGNPVMDAFMDWFFLEYEGQFGSSYGDFPNVSSDRG